MGKVLAETTENAISVSWELISVISGLRAGAETGGARSSQGETQLEQTCGTHKLIHWIMTQAAVLNLDLEMCLKLPEG